MSHFNHILKGILSQSSGGAELIMNLDSELNVTTLNVGGVDYVTAWKSGVLEFTTTTSIAPKYLLDSTINRNVLQFGQGSVNNYSRLDGGNHLNIGTQSFIITMVVKTQNIGTPQFIINKRTATANANGRWHMLKSSDNLYFTGVFQPSSIGVSGTSDPDWVILSMVVDYPNARLSIRENLEEKAFSVFDNTQDLTVSDSVYIGMLGAAVANETFKFNGAIAAIIAHRDVGKVLQEEQRLKTKYGL